MRIKTRVKIGGALTLCVLLTYGAVVLHLDRTMGNLAQGGREANEIVNKITILRSLTQDFLLYHTERAQRQWLAVYAEVLRLLHNPGYRVVKDDYGLGDAPQKLKVVGDTFSRLMTNQPPPGPDNPAGGAGGELQNRLTTQLLLATQDLTTRFFNLDEEINRKLLKTQRLSSIFDILALSILGIVLISNAVFLQRSVVKPVLQLHAGAEIIGAGHLDHKVGLAGRNEIGELSRAFDRMTANIQQVTVSRDELAREIEERNRSEERYRNLFDTLIEGFCTIEMVFDVDGKPVDYRFLEVNPAFEQQTGLYNVQGRLMRDLAPDHEAYWFEIYGKISLTGEPACFENEAKALDRYYEVCAYRVGRPESRQVAILFNDISERKRAEEKLHQTLEGLKRSNRDLEDFAYISSHDLQEPLRKIANFSEMLAQQYRDQLDERAVRYFGYVTDGAKRMQALINDLLSYSRVGRAELRLIPASLEEILKGTMNDLHALIKENHAEISHDPLPTLKVNPHQMGQLLQNLIGNAIKFHNERPPQIHLAARQEGGEWLVCVRDNGIGFEPQYAENIFKVFKRLHSKEQYPGTGIGLAICKKIVERHGGRIWAESEPGRGASFCFTIPA